MVSFFFFKQKTAYEMRISDWSSDVCSSDLSTRKVVDYLRGEIADRQAAPREDLLSYGVTTQIEGRNLTDDELVGFAFNLFIGGLDTVSTNIAWQFRHLAENPEIGRASCRERVCTYV